MIIDLTSIFKYAFYTSMVIFISLTFTSILFGQPDKLTKGFDPDGIACGADIGSKEYPYIYFSNPTPTTLHQSVCVKTCPKPSGMPKTQECVPNSIVTNCQAKFSIDNPEAQFLIYDISSKLLLTELKCLSFDFRIICVFQCLGVIFASQARDAIQNSLDTSSISTFQVDEDYIVKMTSVPDPSKLTILSLIFVILTYYGAYFLYNNYDRIKNLKELFEQVEKFMADHEYNLSNYCSIQFLFLLNHLYNFINESLLCNKLGLLKKFKEFLIIFFFFWGVQFLPPQYNGFKLVTIKTNTIIKNFNTTTINPHLFQPDTFFKKPFILQVKLLRLHFYYQSLQLSFYVMLLKIGLSEDKTLSLNISSPIIAVYLLFLFTIKLNKLKKSLILNQQKKKKNTVNVCLKCIYDYLELSEVDSNVAELFEQLRNTVDSFLLIIKIFIALFCAIICKFILSIKQMSKDLYETNLTCLIAAIVGYCVASFYFQIYSIVLQGLEYIYLRTKIISKKNNENLEKQKKKKDSEFEIFQNAFKVLC